MLTNMVMVMVMVMGTAMAIMNNPTRRRVRKEEKEAAFSINPNELFLTSNGYH